MKKIAKRIVVQFLGWQVRRLRKKNDFKVIGIAGSIGKTSTKFAVATVLLAQYKVQFQQGNYNDLVTVPLIFFGLDEPSLLNPFAWLKTFWQIEKQLHRPYPYEIVVIEISTDGPGQIAAFQKYISLDIGVLTAISPEHMEFFKDLDAVAQEELSVASYTKHLIINADLCSPSFTGKLSNTLTYGVKKTANYQLQDLKFTGEGYEFAIYQGDAKLIEAHHTSIAETQLYSICAAVTVGHQLGMKTETILNGIANIHPVSGRMMHLKGINNSLILDDTYNASPEATKAALNTLYKLEAKQKIAILGNMNELGVYSADAHKEIGEYCDPEQLSLVITIGRDANQYLAVAAEKKGCKVHEFDSPYEAGKFLQNEIIEGAVILAKGSQNGVFAEEVVKLLLADPEDATKLVRQSSQWLKMKAEQFST